MIRDWGAIKVDFEIECALNVGGVIIKHFTLCLDNYSSTFWEKDMCIETNEPRRNLIVVKFLKRIL